MSKAGVNIHYGVFHDPHMKYWAIMKVHTNCDEEILLLL